VSDTVQRLRRAVARLGPGGALREAVRELGLEEVLVLLTRGEQRIANVRKLLRMADREPHAEVLLEQATRSRENGARPRPRRSPTKTTRCGCSPCTGARGSRFRW